MQLKTIILQKANFVQNNIVKNILNKQFLLNKTTIKLSFLLDIRSNNVNCNKTCMVLTMRIQAIVFTLKC